MRGTSQVHQRSIARYSSNPQPGRPHRAFEHLVTADAAEGTTGVMRCRARQVSRTARCSVAWMVTAKRGLRVAYAADTHLHADFVTGAVQLARDDGAAVLASAAGARAYPHMPLGDGDEVDLGGLTLRALAAPGHTDEHLSYLLLDGRQELGVFTGRSLIVGPAARTDLLGAERTGELARAQYHPLRRLAAFPDATVSCSARRTGRSSPSAASSGCAARSVPARPRHPRAGRRAGRPARGRGASPPVGAALLVRQHWQLSADDADQEPLPPRPVQASRRLPPQPRSRRRLR
jgi:glyoxylase-like metal-dependent hydrolase (beta-lactamase superfamily II)